MQQQRDNLEILVDTMYGQRRISVEKQLHQQVRRGNGFLDGLSVVCGVTAEYWSLFIPSQKFRNYLSSKLKYYNFDEMRKQRDKPFLNTKLLKRQYERKGLLGAYEAFWSTQNKAPQRCVRKVYERLGGNEHPIQATIGAFTYSGFVVHALNPFAMLIYVIEVIKGTPNYIPFMMAGVTACYMVAGIPVAYSKLQNQRNVSRK